MWPRMESSNRVCEHFHKMENVKDSPPYGFLFDIIFSSSILNTV